MFKKLNEQEVEDYQNKGAGYYGEYGACIGDATDVIVEGRLGYFLIPISEFEIGKIGIFPGVRLSKKATLAIGGFPKSADETLAEELNVSVQCARDIIYLRSRSRWSQELEDKLIQAHKQNISVNIYEFGVTKQTQVQLHWKVSKSIRDR